MSNFEPNPRAVILTAIPVEYQAVRMHVANLTRVTHKDSIYQRGIFTVGDWVWDIMIVETDQGNTNAALAAERVINYFDPTLVIFVGIAGGLKDVELGDVVVATKVYGYESGKANTDFLMRPDVGRSSYRLVQLARAEGREKDWLRRIKGPLPVRNPKVIVKPIAAGEKVVDSTRSETFIFLTTRYGDAVAVEMEGRGFLEAVYQNQQVDALIVRGISDLIEGKRETDANNWQDTAVRHASAFAFEILAKLDITKLQKSSRDTSSEALGKPEEIKQQEEPVERNHQQPNEASITPSDTSAVQGYDSVLFKKYYTEVKSIFDLCINGHPIFRDQCKRIIHLMEDLEHFFQSVPKNAPSFDLLTKKKQRDILAQTNQLKSLFSELRQMSSSPQNNKRYSALRDTIRSQVDALLKSMDHFRERE